MYNKGKEKEKDMEYYRHKGFRLSAFGMGTTGFWSGRNDRLETNIVRAVKDYGINVVDTAEMYGNGRCEEALGRALKKMGDADVFLVDKILPDNVTERNFEKSLFGSLERLQRDSVDLYLLHWRENCDLSLLVKKMEWAEERGLIGNWGVSNFDEKDMKDLFEAGGKDCFCNQIFYCIYERGVEYSLLPFLKENGVLAMSYSSLGSDYHPHPDIHAVKEITEICDRHEVSVEAACLSLLQEKEVCTLFSTSSPKHLEENLKELSQTAKEEIYPVLNRFFASPDHPYPLVKI